MLVVYMPKCSYESGTLELVRIVQVNYSDLETDGSLTVLLVLYKRPMSCIVGNQASVFFNATT